MTVHIACPSCGFAADFPESFAGRTISCPSCKSDICCAAAEQPMTEDPSSTFTLADADPSPSGARASASRRLIVVGLSLLLLLVGVAVAAYIGSTKRGPDNPPAPAPIAAAGDSPSEKATRPSLPATQPGKIADPGPAPANLALTTVQAIKDATVFIKVEGGSVEGGGSGFLLQANGDSGFVVTNEHVAVPVWSLKASEKPTITLVFRSGTDREQSVPAEIVAADTEHDLAVLKFSGVKELPRPLEMAANPDLVETMPVVIFGFPLGKILATAKRGPAITIGKGSVSSIRTDDRGKVAVVQIDGAINPGNSGGPVVDVRGRLVGVAATSYRGSTHIGLAIPPDQLRSLLGGRVAAVGIYRKVPRTDGADLLGESWLLNDQNALEKSVPDFRSLSAAAAAERDGVIQVFVEAQLLDPLGKVRAVHVHTLAADQLPTPAEPGDRWQPLAKAQKTVLTIRDRTAEATLSLPTTARGAEFYFQLSYEGADGKTIFTQPRALRVDPAPSAIAIATTSPLDEPSDVPDPREKLPAPADLAAAEKLVKEIFADEYARKKRGDVLALAQKLHRQGLDTNDDPAARFVLFREAVHLAARVGGVVQMKRSLGELVTRYAVDPLAVIVSAFETAAGAAATREDAEELAGDILVLYGLALAYDDFPAADRLARAGETAARSAQSAPLLLAFRDRREELPQIRADFSKALLALATLKKKPEDAEASRIAGRYLCLVKGNWDKGLPLLVKGSDTKLKELAEMDLSSPPKSAGQVEVGDAWYEFGDSQRSVHARTLAHLRAATWYQEALPSLTGVFKIRAAKRVAEVERYLVKSHANPDPVPADPVKPKDPPVNGPGVPPRQVFPLRGPRGWPIDRFGPRVRPILP